MPGSVTIGGGVNADGSSGGGRTGLPVGRQVLAWVCVLLCLARLGKARGNSGTPLFRSVMVLPVTARRAGSALFAAWALVAIATVIAGCPKPASYRVENAPKSC